MFLIYEHDIFLLFLVHGFNVAFLLRITGLAGSSVLSGLDCFFAVWDGSSGLPVCSSNALVCSTVFPMLSIDKLTLDSTNSLNSRHSSFLLVRASRTSSGFILLSFNILKKLSRLNVKRMTK